MRIDQCTFDVSRLHVGTEIGLFDTDIDWDTGDRIGNVRKRHDAKSLNLSGRLGTINTSCGDDGLYSAIDDFGIHNSARRGFHRTANQSVRSGWLGYLLANYPTNNSVFLFRTSHEAAPKQTSDIDTREGHVITDISPTPYQLTTFIDSELKSRGISDQHIQYSFNSAHLVFYYTFNFEFLSFRVREGKAGLSVDFKTTQKADGVRILNAQPFAEGAIVIETDDRVFLLSRNTWHTLLPTPAISVRTFPRSKRFQNLICITTEDGIYVTCAIDPSNYTIP